MRTYDDLCAALAACEIPYARVSWEPLDPDDTPTLPHALLVPRRSRNKPANDAVACHVTPYDVELYLDGSSIELELRVQAALEAAGFNGDRYVLPLGGGVAEVVWASLDCIEQLPEPDEQGATETPEAPEDHDEKEETP